MCSSTFCFTLLQKPGVEGPMQWFSSTATRVAQLKEPRSAEPNVSSNAGRTINQGLWENWWASRASCETPLSVQMIASLVILVLQLKGDVKEPLTSRFETE